MKTSSFIGSAVDTFLFFSISFYATGIPWVTLSLGDLAVKIFIALVMLIPLLLLAIGAISAGFLFKEIFIGNNSQDFWKTSIFFMSEIQHDDIPMWLLLITPIIVVISIPISFYYYISNTKILEEFKNTNLPLYKFLLNKFKKRPYKPPRPQNPAIYPEFCVESEFEV